MRTHCRKKILSSRERGGGFCFEKSGLKRMATERGTLGSKLLESKGKMRGAPGFLNSKLRERRKAINRSAGRKRREERNLRSDRPSTQKEKRGEGLKDTKQA